jgi:5-(hydroxymethyl)furfural/furfural oxidase
MQVDAAFSFGSCAGLFPSSVRIAATMEPTHIIVGGGTAGCVVAARLSENSSNRVLLLEAGCDIGPGNMPDDIRQGIAALPASAPQYFWPRLTANRGSEADADAGRARNVRYFQARIMGGGSSINAQMSAWNAAADYNRWAEMGANGWDWQNVVPWLRTIENDLDFPGPEHGHDGPIAIRRTPPDEWDTLSKAARIAWMAMGFPYIADANASFDDGFSPIPYAHDGSQRMTTAVVYLDARHRSAENLAIQHNTTVERIIIEGRRAVGVLLADGNMVRAPNIVLAAGALHSPRLLMLSGVGPAQHLIHGGIDVVADRPGVGENLQNHPMLSIAGFLPPAARPSVDARGMYGMLRYSSGMADCPSGDMRMLTRSGLSWHGIGRRLGMVSCMIGKVFSRGTVRLSSPDPKDIPTVHHNLLGDPRDIERMVKAYLMVSEMLRRPSMSSTFQNPFVAILSDRVIRANRRTRFNEFVTECGGLLMDSNKHVRRLIIEKLVAETPPLFRSDMSTNVIAGFLRSTVSSTWHDCGTCRMGRTDDPLAVTDSRGRVIGVHGLFVADASIMPEIPAINTNMPTIMIAERISHHLNSP